MKQYHGLMLVCHNATVVKASLGSTTMCKWYLTFPSVRTEPAVRAVFAFCQAGVASGGPLPDVQASGCIPLQSTNAPDSQRTTAGTVSIFQRRIIACTRWIIGSQGSGNLSGRIVADGPLSDLQRQNPRNCFFTVGRSFRPQE